MRKERSMPKLKIHQPKTKPSRSVYDKPATVAVYSHYRFWAVEHYLCNLYLNQPGKILDVACAAGRVSIPLAANYGFQVIGFDISGNQVKAANQKARKDKLSCYFFQSDMTSMALAGRTMDYILITYSSLGACITLEARQIALKEIARVLKSNGVAFISVWNRLWPGRFGLAWIKWIWLGLLRVFRLNPHAQGNQACWEQGEHVLWHYFWPWEARNLFKKMGFDILDIIPYSGSWHKNRMLNKNWLSKLFGQGLFFVLVKRCKKLGSSYDL